MDDKKQPHYIGHRERLRERFLQDDGQNMSDYELMELLLMIAIPRRDVKEKAKDLINTFGSFSAAINASVEKLERFGLKRTTAAVLKIVAMSAVRVTYGKLSEKDVSIFTDPDALINHCRAMLSEKEVEEFWVLYFDSKAQLIKEELMQRGTVNNVWVPTREVVRVGLECGAVNVVLTHNHPSGDPDPSDSDVQTTRSIITGLDTVGMKLVDHIIVGKNDYYSFTEHRLLIKKQ